MKRIFNEIWQAPLPCLSTRMNAIHTEIAMGFANIRTGEEGGEEDFVFHALCGQLAMEQLAVRIKEAALHGTSCPKSRYRWFFQQSI